MSARLSPLFVTFVAMLGLLLPTLLRIESSPVVVAAAEKLAPDFTLQDATGAPVRLSALRGRVVLLDFWATWCTGCKVEIPWFVAFDHKYASQGLTTIGAAMDEEGWEKVRPYLREHPIPYSIVIGSPALMQPYAITNLPVTLLIDHRGAIAETHLGVVDKDEWENKIQTLLSSIDLK
jgi:cytochrome c biogenesis protein CcmG/thiol:disulfide interchange protein DsbE